MSFWQNDASTERHSMKRHETDDDGDFKDIGIQTKKKMPTKHFGHYSNAIESLKNMFFESHSLLFQIIDI